MNVVYFNAEKFYRLAYDYLNYEDNPAMAEKWVNLALENDKSHIKSKVLKGEILLKRGNIKQALKIFFEILKSGYNNNGCVFGECLLNIAKAYCEEKKLRLSLKYLEKIFVNKFNENFDDEFLSKCYSLKVKILIGLNQYKKAEQILKMLENLLPYDEICNLDENLYKTVHHGDFQRSDKENRILHINFN